MPVIYKFDAKKFDSFFGDAANKDGARQDLHQVHHRLVKMSVGILIQQVVAHHGVKLMEQVV